MRDLATVPVSQRSDRFGDRSLYSALVRDNDHDQATAMATYWRRWAQTDAADAAGTRYQSIARAAWWQSIADRQSVTSQAS